MGMRHEPTANKEQIYDERIHPLMAQILAICKEHKIAMLASFAIPNEDDPDLRCTSCLLEDEYEPPPDFVKAKNIIVCTKPTMFAFTITERRR
jgi:hypothetical protein